MTRLTEPQRWALRAIADGYGVSPAYLGQRMMERPGVAERRVYKDSPQGLGRIGGTMMARLQKAGLVRLSSGYGSNWHPTRAVLTDAGRAALKEGRDE